MRRMSRGWLVSTSRQSSRLQACDIRAANRQVRAEDRPLAKAELLDEQGEADGGRLSASISWGHAPRRVWPALAALPDTKCINQLDRGSSKIKLPVVT